MSRAAWLALGSSAAALGCAVTLTACAGDDTEGTTASAEPPEDGGGTGARPDAGNGSVGASGDVIDANASDAGEVIDANAAAGPTFPCGDAACVVSSEFCIEIYDTCGYPVNFSCVPWSSLTPPCSDQTCNCFDSPSDNYGACGTVDGGGTVVDEVDETGMDPCDPCYGCPPARLERLARLPAAV